MTMQRELRISLSEILEQKLSYSNVSILVVGDPGQGKSFSCILLAKGLDPNFTAENIVFSALDYIKKIDTAQKREAIVFDDAGRGIPARDWNTISNKLISYTQETVRYLRQIIFWNTPDSSLIDKIPRKLFNYVLYSKFPGYTKIYELKHNRLTGKTYYQFPQISHQGKLYTIDHIRVKIQEEDKYILKEYEQKKAEYLRRDRKEIIKKLEGATLP